MHKTDLVRGFCLGIGAVVLVRCFLWVQLYVSQHSGNGIQFIICSADADQYILPFMTGLGGLQVCLKHCGVAMVVHSYALWTNMPNELSSGIASSPYRKFPTVW